MCECVCVRERERERERERGRERESKIQGIKEAEAETDAEKEAWSNRKQLKHTLRQERQNEKYKAQKINLSKANPYTCG